MGRHAYLIMAHGQFELLRRLVCMLDDPRNDIYLHMDSKAGLPGEQAVAACGGLLCFAGFLPIARTSVVWGGYSQIACELALLRAAAPGRYDYYHLLSGADLPIQTQDTIDAFFQAHAGFEFVQCQALDAASPLARRVNLYYPLQEHMRPGARTGPQLALHAAGKALEWLQRLAGVRRRQLRGCSLGYGSNWFSITHALCEYLLAQQAWIRRAFAHTHTADEIFLPTLVLRSPYAQKLYIIHDEAHPQDLRAANQRLIDWQRGSPYVWRLADWPQLQQSPLLFARKFNKTDMAVVKEVYALYAPAHQQAASAAGNMRLKADSPDEKDFVCSR